MATERSPPFPVAPTAQKVLLLTSSSGEKNVGNFPALIGHSFARDKRRGRGWRRLSKYRLATNHEGDRTRE